MLNVPKGVLNSVGREGRGGRTGGREGGCSEDRRGRRRGEARLGRAVRGRRQRGEEGLSPCCCLPHSVCRQSSEKQGGMWGCGRGSRRVLVCELVVFKHHRSCRGAGRCVYAPFGDADGNNARTDTDTPHVDEREEASHTRADDLSGLYG
eukprot:441767-Rhodomonas_salina.3